MKFKKVFSKRILAGIVALTTVAATASFTSTTALNSDMQYKIFNNYTGSLTSTYTLSALATDPNIANTRGIVGPNDDRDSEIGSPAKGIVRIVSADGDSYTGFVVGDNIIATAASNVYDRSAGTFEKISTISLYNENGTVSGSATASRVHIPSGYITAGLTYCNYALIKVTSNISSHHVFDLGVPLDVDDSKIKVTVAGFPDIKNNLPNTTMYEDTDEVTKYSQQPVTVELAYLADVTDGQQGSPVYMSRDYFNSGSNEQVKYNIVLAINSSGDDYNTMYSLSGQKINYGVRVTTDILHFYNNNPNI